MAEKKEKVEAHRPLKPEIVLDLSEQPAHSSFTRYLTFQNHAGQYKRLAVAFHRTGPLRWEVKSFPNGIDTLRSLADQGNRFRAEGTLCRYNSGTNLQAFVHATSGVRYTSRPGDFLERRKDNKSQHSMLILRWLPGDLTMPHTDPHHYNRAIVFNGPWPVTQRLARIHEDETNLGVDFWLGRID